jgi:hypothetical protein
MLQKVKYMDTGVRRVPAAADEIGSAFWAFKAGPIEKVAEKSAG